MTKHPLTVVGVVGGTLLFKQPILLFRADYGITYQGCVASFRTGA